MKLQLVLFAGFLPFGLCAQNVGIGTLSPLVKLHVANGSSGNPTPFSPMVIEGDHNTYINLLSTDISETAVLFGKTDNAASGGIIYNNTNNLNGLQFRTNGNATRMVIDNGGNVGIGITNPNAPLSFSTTTGKKITFYAGGTGDYGIAVQGQLLQLYTDNPGADIAFGYDVGGTITERMRIKGNGNLGIGTNNPSARLHISSGDASLALFGPNSYGGQLYVGAALNQGVALTAQVLSSDGNLHIDPAPGKNIYLGYYQARDIYLNPAGGNIGIGNSNPGYRLDVSNRMRIRSGGNNTVSAGLWLNNNANTEAAFMGMEDDTHVGFYGIGSGFRFVMNTQTGALKINGSEGTAGQVLQSNGSNAPGWASSTNTLYSKSAIVYGTSSASQPFPLGAAEALITGLTYTFTVTGNAKVFISFSIPMYTNYCAFCNSANARLRLRFNGVLVGAYMTDIPSESYFQFSSSLLIPVVAGTYTVEMFAHTLGGQGMYVYGSSPIATNSMVVQVIPE